MIYFWYDVYSMRSSKFESVNNCCKIFELDWFKTIYPREKGPTQELYSSSRRTAVVPLFKNYMLFFGYFLGWVMLLHPQATSTDHGGPHGDYEDLFIRLSYGMQ